MGNDNIDNMIASVLSKNKDVFSSAFKSEMEERIGSSVVDKNLEISKDIITNDTEEDVSVEEAKQEPSTYTFRSSSDAKKFVSAASNTGLSKKSFSIKKDIVTVSGVKNKEMREMLQMLAKDMKAKAH